MEARPTRGKRGQTQGAQLRVVDDNPSENCHCKRLCFRGCSSVWPVRWRRCFAVFLLVAGTVQLFSTETSEAANGQPSASQTSLPNLLSSPVDSASFVRPLAPDILHRTLPDRRARRLVQAYIGSILQWDDILLARIEPVPGKPDCAYYGGKTQQENDIRPITYAAMVNAFLAEAELPGCELSPERRQRMRADAVAALRYLLQAHVTGNGDCVNGRRWGNQWQSAMWARSVGLACWFMWCELPDDLKQGVARLVEFEADRFLKLKPKSRELLDTGAEENAWNAQMLSLACNLMPKHPRAVQWADAAKLWMYNSLSVAADAHDGHRGDDSRAIKDWVCTTNAHPDFTVENHGIVHVGYLKNTVSMLLENALPYLLTGAPVPQASHHHTAEGFEVVLRCMGWEAAPVYFSGNDWKLVQTQSEDLMKYALMSLLAGNRNAAYLEEVAIGFVARQQRLEDGYYNVRRDIEYGGLCATRLITACLAHATLGAGAEPVSETAFNRHISGVTLLEYGKVLFHRTPTKFASFSWGPKRMGLALPTDGLSVVWPHFASYVGEINGQDASATRAKLRAVRHETHPDGFTMTVVLDRFSGAVEQSVSFTSLPDDIVIYLERLKMADGFQLRSRETGIVGLEYELGRNARALFTAAGKLKTLGGGGEPAVRTFETNWLNISDRVGHVVIRQPGRRNYVRHHDEAAGGGRVPKLQEWLSLIGDESTSDSTTREDWVCLVTFLNQKHRDTAKSAERVRFTVDDQHAVCRIGRHEVRADFSTVKPH